MEWTDGSKYIGQWVRGIQHGDGKMVFPDGTEKEGYFENNIFRGQKKQPGLKPKALTTKKRVNSKGRKKSPKGKTIEQFSPSLQPAL